ncbi:MAG: fatty acid desaturase, partial [Verrucomicrobiales bacterium]
MPESSAHAHQPPSRSEVVKWKKIVAEFEKPSAARATWQLVTTLGLYFAAWAGMYQVINTTVSLWWLLPLVPLAGGLLVRVFIMFHDCCHNSFFKSEKLNRVVGFFTGVLAFTPYKHWRWEHSIHHATSGDLDRRGVGDIWTLTVDEYLKLGRKERIVYAMVRNPFILFMIVPV